PYWEDFPIRAKFASSHVDSIRRRMAVAFPGKEILIGETGWPSEGRMREGALPSRTNQARVVSEILSLAKRENFRVNLIEAYDQPWKRRLEGTVGGYWGLFDSVQRAVKYPPGQPVSNYPLWKLQMGAGMALSAIVFLTGWLTVRRKHGLSTYLLGLTLVVTVLIGTETALGFVFDPRYRDFPFASLTMAVVPFALLLLNRPVQGIRPIAEATFAGLLAASAVYVGFN